MSNPKKSRSPEMAFVLFLLIVISGCDGSPSEPGIHEGEPILTDQLSYELVPDTVVILGDTFPLLRTEIDYVLRNQSARPFYIVRCHEPVVLVEKQDPDGGWAPFWLRGAEDCLGPPIVIEAGKGYEGSFELSGAEAGVEGYSPSFPTNDFEGRYRMAILKVVYLADPADYPDGTPVESDLVRSNSFELTVR